MGAVDRRKQMRVAFQNGARFDFIGQAAKFLVAADRQTCLPQDLTCFARDPAKIDGKLKGLRRGFDRNQNGWRGWWAQSHGRPRRTKRGFLASVSAYRDRKCHAKAPWRDDTHRPTDPRITHACLTPTGRYGAIGRPLAIILARIIVA